jgi:uncharacterized protein YjbI with pentapeptide repeats
MSSSTVGGLLVEEDEVEDEVLAKSSGEVVPPVLGGSGRTYVPLKAKHLVRLVQKMSHERPLKLSGMDLQGLSLCGMDLTGARLFRCDLRGVDFQWANLTEATLTDCNLTGANLKGAKPPTTTHPRPTTPAHWARLGRCDAVSDVPGPVRDAWGLLGGYPLAPPAPSSTGQRARRSLPRCTLRAGANMREVQLANTNLTRANLSGTHVGQRNQPRGIAKNTRLNCLCCVVSAGANLHLARLGKAQLRRANLSGACQPTCRRCPGAHNDFGDAHSPQERTWRKPSLRTLICDKPISPVLLCPVVLLNWWKRATSADFSGHQTPR